MNPKLSLALGILFISFSPIFVRLAGVPPITSAFYRIFIAFICLAPYCIIKQKLKIKRNELLIALTGGIVFGLDIFVWNISLFKIAATVSTLIANLAPVWVGLISYLLFKINSGRFYWLGTVIAIGGMVVLVGLESLLKLQLNSGVLLAVLASVFYAIYILITKGILQKIEMLTFMFYSMLSASVFLLAICLIEQDNLTEFSNQAWLYLAGLGIICQLAGWLTINFSLKFLPSPKVSVALLSQTVIAGVWATLLLHEKLQLKEIIGSLVVLVGIGITFLKANTIKRSPETV